MKVCMNCYGKLNKAAKVRIMHGEDLDKTEKKYGGYVQCECCKDELHYTDMVIVEE